MSIQFSNDDIQREEGQNTAAQPVSSQPLHTLPGRSTNDASVMASASETMQLPRIRGRTLIRKTRQSFHNRWPWAIGVAEIIFGFITLTLGTVETLVIPLVLDRTDGKFLGFEASNAYGVGMWTGTMLILTGALAVRASITKRATTVYRFYLLTSFTLAVYISAIILIVVGFSEKWTPDKTESETSALYNIHMVMSVTVFIGFLLALVAFINYYEDVWFGELQLCKRCGKIFCPCFCPLAMDCCDCLSFDQTIGKRVRSETVTSDTDTRDRTPSMPV